MRTDRQVYGEWRRPSGLPVNLDLGARRARFERQAAGTRSGSGRDEPALQLDRHEAAGNEREQTTDDQERVAEAGAVRMS